MTKLSLPLAYRCSTTHGSARNPYPSMIQHLQIKILNPVHLCFHPQKFETREKFGFEIIPTEIILKIFQFLSIPDLKHAILVAKNWNEIGNTAILWKRARIKITFQTLTDLPEILNLKNSS